KGFPQYSIDSTSIEANGENYDVTVYVKQKLLEREMFTDDNRIEIAFMKPDFSVETRVLEFSGETGNQTFTLPFEPALVMCDYYEHTSDATIDDVVFVDTTKALSFLKTDCDMSVQEIEGEAMIRVTCNYVAPDDFLEPVDGLEIVPSRYWLVESLRPEVFSGKLIITFNTSTSGWENPYIELSMLDSVALLHRSNRSENWSVVPARYVKAGRQFTVENFADGEYALAIRNGYVGTSKLTESSFSVYPNPSSGIVNLTFESAFSGDVNVIDMSGKVLVHKKIRNSEMELNLKHLSAGTYVVSVSGKSGMASRKIEIR
ncbi:MAG: T9SS type A sorting domain-containing protein, partial [Bacteroidales bacterium]|nr:T9SS type A sorting domain-containing protein [Bacteroidales bacterium]